MANRRMGLVLAEVVVLAGLTGLGGMAGCGAPPSIDEVSSRLAKAGDVGGSIEFQSEGGALDAPGTLAGTLTLEAAVRETLVNDPDVQAAMARVRVRLAEAKQTRLLPNPVLSVAFRFPEGGGSPTIEAGLAMEMLSLIQRPRQASAADHRLRVACAEVLRVGLDVVAEVQERYAAVQALEAEKAVLAERLRIMDRLVGISEARLKSGEAARLDVLTLSGQRAALRTEIIENDAACTNERLALARLLGRPGGEAKWAVSPWVSPRMNAGSEAEWIAAGLKHRPEVEAARWELLALGDDAALARWSFLEGSPGVSAERDPTWTVGPSIDMPLPVFDWGQAKQERVNAEVAEARHAMTKAMRGTVEDVRKAWASLAAARQVVEMIETELIPLQDKRQTQSEAQYKNGFADVTAVLLAAQDAQESRSKLIEWQKNVATASVRLQRAVGGANVAAAVNAASDAATQPAK